MAGKTPLRRWKPFFPAFGIVDAAIEASAPGLCRDKVRSARSSVVELLRGVPAADDRKAEELCVLLDGFMAESLLTLQAVPVDAVPRILASSADLAKAVGALRRHESERVRELARGVIKGWAVAVEEDMARTSAAMKRLDDVCRTKAVETSHPKTNKTGPVAVAGHGPRRMENMKAPTKNRDLGGGQAEKMEAAKRKLRQGYQEVEDAKRQRKIQVIQAPKKVEQKQRKIHPIMRERAPFSWRD